MTNLNQQIIYDKVKNNLNTKTEEILDNINELIEKGLEDKDIDTLAEYFITLSNLNQAKTLVSSIKPTEKQA